MGREGDDRPARRQQGIRATAGRRLPPPVRAEVPDPPPALRRPVRPRPRAARHERLLSLPSACCVALPGVEAAEQLVDARVRAGRRPQSAREPLRRLRRQLPRRREAVHRPHAAAQGDGDARASCARSRPSAGAGAATGPASRTGCTSPRRAAEASALRSGRAARHESARPSHACTSRTTGGTGTPGRALRRHPRLDGVRAPLSDRRCAYRSWARSSASSTPTTAASAGAHKPHAADAYATGSTGGRRGRGAGRARPRSRSLRRVFVRRQALLRDRRARPRAGAYARRRWPAALRGLPDRTAGTCRCGRPRANPPRGRDRLRESPRGVLGHALSGPERTGYCAQDGYALAAAAEAMLTQSDISADLAALADPVSHLPRSGDVDFVTSAARQTKYRRGAHRSRRPPSSTARTSSPSVSCPPCSPPARTGASG